MNKLEIVSNKTAKASQRVISYWVLAIGLVLIYVLIRDSGWQGDKQLHTLMEITATILALIIGIMSLVHYYTNKNLVFLMIGVGFLGTGFLDGYHAVVTSSYFAKYFTLDVALVNPLVLGRIAIISGAMPLAKLQGMAT